MFICMKRTTLILEDGCMRKVRALARQEGRQMSHVVNELLAEGLRRRQAHPKSKPFRLPSFDMGPPRVNLADRDALESVMEK